MKTQSACLALLLAGFGPLSAAVITFGTADDFTNNFRSDNIAFTYSSATSAMRHAGNNTTGTAIYDLNGAVAGSTTFNIAIGSSLTVSADVLFSGNSSSFGVMIVGGGIGHLALLNPTAANDQFRIFSGADITGGAGSNTGLPNDSTANVITAGTYFNIVTTYSVISSNSYSISITAGGKTVSHTFTGAPSTGVEVGFRAFNSPDSGAFVDVDNVSVVPEPSSLLLLGTAGLLAFRRRRP